MGIIPVGRVATSGKGVVAGTGVAAAAGVSIALLVHFLPLFLKGSPVYLI